MSDVPQGPDWWQDAEGRWHPPTSFGTPQAPSTASPPGQPPAPGTSPYGQPAHGPSPYGQPAYGQSPYGAPMYAGPTTRTSNMAIGGLIVGVLAWFFCPFVGALVGLGLGLAGRKEIHESNGAVTGDGIAIAAIAVSAVHLLIFVGFIALFVGLGIAR